MKGMGTLMMKFTALRLLQLMNSDQWMCHVEVDGIVDGIIHDEVYSFKTSILNRLRSVDGYGFKK